jgi:hypothetical protein
MALEFDRRRLTIMFGDVSEHCSWTTAGWQLGKEMGDGANDKQISPK